MTTDPTQGSDQTTNFPVTGDDGKSDITQVKPEELPNPMDDVAKSDLPDFSQVNDKNQLDQDAVAKEPKLGTTEDLPEELKLSPEEDTEQAQNISMRRPTTETSPTKTAELIADPTNPPVVESTSQPVNESTNQRMANAFGVGQSQTVAPSTPLPDELKGWNWGAFFLSWIWAIGNQVWIGLLAILGPLWIIMIIILGLKGNEWVWKARKFASVEDFKKTQSAWAKWGLGLFIIQIIIIILIISAVVSAYNSSSTTTTSTTDYQYQY